MQHSVKILYTNWRGMKSERTILPEKIYFGKNQWHTDDTWLLDAFDVEKSEKRSFAIKDIVSWKEL